MGTAVTPRRRPGPLSPRSRGVATGSKGRVLASSAASEALQRHRRRVLLAL